MNKQERMIVLDVMDHLQELEVDLARAAHFGTLHDASKDDILKLFNRVHDCASKLNTSLLRENVKA